MFGANRASRLQERERGKEAASGAGASTRDKSTLSTSAAKSSATPSKATTSMVEPIQKKTIPKSFNIFRSTTLVPQTKPKSAPKPPVLAQTQETPTKATTTSAGAARATPLAKTAANLTNHTQTEPVQRSLSPEIPLTTSVPTLSPRQKQHLQTMSVANDEACPMIVDEPPIEKTTRRKSTPVTGLNSTDVNYKDLFGSDDSDSDNDDEFVEAVEKINSPDPAVSVCHDEKQSTNSRASVLMSPSIASKKKNNQLIEHPVISIDGDEVEIITPEPRGSELPELEMDPLRAKAFTNADMFRRKLKAFIDVLEDSHNRFDLNKFKSDPKHLISWCGNVNTFLALQTDHLQSRAIEIEKYLTLLGE